LGVNNLERQEPGQQLLIGKLAALTREFPYSCLLLSNGYPGSSSELLAGFSSIADLEEKEPENCFNRLEKLPSGTFRFGHFSYELKCEVENLPADPHQLSGFSASCFFTPEHLLKLATAPGSVAEAGPATFDLILRTAPALPGPPTEKITIQAKTSREEYLRQSKKLLEHIHRGDIYEINYCIGFYAENVKLDPPSLFLRLNELGGAPFSALYRNRDSWLICASPERFLAKKGTRIFSQPIKGTRPRGATAEEDRAQALSLASDPKEQSENVMIVDLVRNDLSKIARRGTVKVDELFGIHSFRTVHQMISTVSAELRDDISAAKAIRAAFPMGSMTGAPKLRAMELAAEAEQMPRGLYSGAVGYFTPDGDFDFNVVIRSILYNAATGYLSFMVGSALTAAADPEKEYEECLVKARALFRALGVKWKE
jgi:para-aminobenzoate synthetase component 1